MITVNSHIHSKYSQDAKGEIKEIIKNAKECGLKIITLTDHFPTQGYSKMNVPDCNMKKEDVGEYLKLKNNKIDLRIGFEIDYADGFDLEIPDVDYALGGVHIIDGMCFDYSEEKFVEAVKTLGSVKNLYSAYFKLIRGMVKTRKFDCVAHLDLIKKFNKNNKYFSEEEEGYRNDVLGILDLIKEKNIVMEINTRGLSKPTGEQYPSRWIIKEAFNRKIDITIGSDCHAPKGICQGYEVVENLLKEIGYGKTCIFKKRKKEYVKV